MDYKRFNATDLRSMGAGDMMVFSVGESPSFSNFKSKMGGKFEQETGLLIDRATQSPRKIVVIRCLEKCRPKQKPGPSSRAEKVVLCKIKKQAVDEVNQEYLGHPVRT